MEPACRKDKSKLNSTPTRGDRARQKSAQQELKQRQRAEVTSITVLNFEAMLRSILFSKKLNSGCTPTVLYVTLPLSLVLLIVSPVLLFLLQIYALNKVMTELEQQQFETFCKQMQSQGE